MYRQNNIRKCPNCEARVERDAGEGCMNMLCYRCKTTFCWSCMLPLDVHDKKWWLKCPKLPFSMCKNIVLTVLVLLFLPLLLLIVPILHAMMLGVRDWSQLLTERCESKGMHPYASGPLTFVFTIHFIIPICIIIGSIVSAFLLVFGSIPLYFLCFTYLFRLISLQCGLSCCGN